MTPQANHCSQKQTKKKTPAATIMTRTCRSRIEKWPTLLLGCLVLLQAVKESASFQSFVLPKRYQNIPSRRTASIAVFSSDEAPVEKANLVESYDQDKTYQSNLEISRLANLGTADSARQAHALLTELEYPDTVSYNGVLKAYAKSNQPQPAIELLECMERLQDSHNGSSPSMIRPNVISYSTVMDACCRHQEPIVARKILARLVERYAKSQDETLRPNTIVYNCMLSAYAKSGLGQKAADLSVQLLEKMGDLADVVSYNIVFHAMAQSGDGNCGERAQSLFDNIRVTPNARTYSTLMDCWARSDHENRADIVYSLLNQMEMDYNKTGHVVMRPNAISYSVAIKSFASSKDPQKVERAYQVLQHMMQLSESGANPWAKPTLVTFNSVLNVCATSPPQKGSKRVQEIVDDVYKKLLCYDQPDEYTYGTMLKACANVFLGDPNKPQLAQDIFDAACEAGCVSFGVCYQFKQAAPSDLFRAVLPVRALNAQTGHFDVSKLPKEWTINVKNGGAKRSIHS